MTSESTTETSVTYKEGDIAWVKLSSTWWPCEVRDSGNLPPDVEFKKPPLAVVKFFEEDTYEYIRSWNQIYPYNCEKKVEFIKKGMAAFRSNVSHMEKFPKDVTNAEILVGGNPNILSDPMFIPEKKRNDEGRSKKSSKSDADIMQAKSHITHRRFLGVNDFQMYICIQSTEKDRIPGNKDDDEVILLNSEPEKKYSCYYCHFSTKRLEVMVFHKKNHYVTKNDSKSAKKRPAINKTKKEKTKRAKISLNKKSLENKEKRAPRYKQKNKSMQSKKSTKEIKVEETPKNASDIRSDLLAEWDDEDDDQIENNLENSSEITETHDQADMSEEAGVTNAPGLSEADGLTNTKGTNEKTLESSSNSLLTEKEESLMSNISTQDENTPEESSHENDKSKKMDQATEQAIKSCFDFDEEDEEEGSVIIPTTVSGRKIPRVIPLTEKRKSTDISTEETENSQEELDTAFDELMETTNVPDLPDLHRTLKCEQNFHKSKTIKFPDKSSDKTPHLINLEKNEKTELTEVATKLTNPKKRFVKSFEDFELKQNVNKKKEQKEMNMNKQFDNPDDNEKIKEKSGERNTSGFSKLKTHIMSKITQDDIDQDSEKNEIDASDNIEICIVDKCKSHEKDMKTFDSNQKTYADKPSGSHKLTPRSKILETYFSKNTKEKDESKAQSLLINYDEFSNERNHNILPKKKLQGRISHPKKDKMLFNFFLNTEDVQKNKRDKQTEDNDKELQALEENKSDELNETDNIKISNETDIMESEKVITCNTNLKEGILPNRDTGSIELTTETNYDLPNQQIISKSPEKLTNFHLQLDFSGHDKEIQGHKNNDDVKTSFTSQIMPKNIEIIKDNIVDESESNNENVDVQKSLNTPTIETTCSLEILFGSEKEEHPVLEKASTCLPDDAICSPPRKRRQSDDEISEVSVRSEPIKKKIKIKVKFDENKPESNDNFTDDCCLLQEVSECVDELITKVCQPQYNLPLVSETNDIFGNAKIIENEQKENVLEIFPNSNNQEPIEIVENERGDSTVTHNLSGNRQKEHLEDCQVSDYTNEEIVEEVLYCTEQDTVVEELIESHEGQSPEIGTMSGDVNEDASNYDDSKKIVNMKDNINCEYQNSSEIIIQQCNLVDETIKTISDSTLGARTVQGSCLVNVTTERISDNSTSDSTINKSDLFHETSGTFSDKNDLCKSDDMMNEKYHSRNIIDIDITSEKNISRSSVPDTPVSRSEIAHQRDTVSDDNISSVNEISSTISIKEPHSDHIVNVEGNLTVVSELDLGEGQVEITSEQIISSANKNSHFSTDLSNSLDASASASDLSSEISIALDIKSNGNKKEYISNELDVAYGRTELLDILEGEADVEKKIKLTSNKNMIEDFCDFEDHIPSQIVCATRLKQEKDDVKDKKDKGGTTKKNYKIASTASKLLERLTESKKDVKHVKSDVTENVTESASLKAFKGKPSLSKPIILSEQIIKPASDKPVPKFKKTLNDIEDIETFIIHKDPKKNSSEIDTTDPQLTIEKKNAKVGKSSGKAKILQQTIITASGEIIQPAVTVSQSDENVFDINSMPIVLSDSILTPENIEKMTVLSSDQPTTSATINPTNAVVMTGKNLVDNKMLIKPASTLAVSVCQPSSSLNLASKSIKTSRILQTSSSRIIHRSTSLNSSKPGKYILVPQSSTLPTTKGVVKKMVLKRSPIIPNKQPCNSPDIRGNKIMILTNQQGQQQRLLLTPAQQKVLGCQSPNAKLSKTIIKGNLLQSSSAVHKTLISGSTTETKLPSEGKLLPSTEQSVLLVNTPLVPEKKVIQTSNVSSAIKTGRPLQSNYRSTQNVGKLQQTVLLKKQAVKRIKETNEDLEKQVAEQLEAIKASSTVKVESRVKTPETIKTFSKASSNQFLKKNEPKYKFMSTALKISKSEEIRSPNLTPLSSKQSSIKESIKKEIKVPLERPLNQLVVQDAVGNQTTIVEGQILALPSETINGQPQSYILVTLDQTGALTPLNNEALMSLDPNLDLGGDIGNTVLQIEQGTLTSAGTTRSVSSSESVIVKPSKDVGNNVMPINSQEQLSLKNAKKVQANENTNDPLLLKPKVTDVLLSNQNIEQTVASNANPSGGQQLIISGDPLATQKFLESLTEGTTDLANLLATADGSGILIQADGQQILINTETSNQVLLSSNTENVGVSENNENNTNPIFATQLNKSQDILAAALADTDVFQQDHNLSQNKFSSQLSPNNSLYSINVGNVLETSLTLSSPIMTPLEVPSTNSKKIPDEEADILTQVPKNVDLPITITDPNISQTVANQQVSSFITTELPTNLELTLPISETAIPSVSKDLHSPSFSYGLSTLEDSEDITQKTFSSSMPILNEDGEESTDIKVESNEIHHKRYPIGSSTKENKVLKEALEINKSESVERTSFLEDDEEEKGRFTLGREMCSSLSEPPPEMFDLAEVNSSFGKNTLPISLQSTPDSAERSKDEELTDMSIQAENSSDGSCEIPVQPKIFAKSQNLDLLNSD